MSASGYKVGPLILNISVALGHALLDGDRAGHGIDDARKLGDDAVASAAEHPAMMACDQPFYDLSVGA